MIFLLQAGRTVSKLSKHSILMKIEKDKIELQMLTEFWLSSENIPC